MRILLGLISVVVLSGCYSAVPPCRSGHIVARMAASYACVPTQAYDDSVNASLRASIDSLRAQLDSVKP